MVLFCLTGYYKTKWYLGWIKSHLRNWDVIKVYSLYILLHFSKKLQFVRKIVKPDEIFLTSYNKETKYVEKDQNLSLIAKVKV